ncbi:macrolide family glycosyltransferase [Staphylococcus sp. Marseille-Q5304]|uniref:macrolide family glycosyltransferase n=1 Tax=Staphylococcus sp. Marseille-Q5304 TaxID=2942200 RepID=UPI00207414DE|nr:macrolide family glycosyltransferase [Staphylococcus sp. Marseille-Q5304]
MSKILFVNPGSTGHLNPTIALCKALVERGEEIVYYASDQYKDKFNHIDMEVRTLPTQPIIEAFTTFKPNNLYNVINGLLNTVDHIVPQILEEIQDEQYDYLIYDSMFGCGNIISQKLNIPTIASVTSFAHTKQTFDFLLNKFAEILSEDELKQADKNFNKLKEAVETKYDVRVPNRFEVMHNPGDLNLSYVMENFQINKELFDSDRYYFAGPSVKKPQPSEFVQNLDTSKPLIYISLGTVFNKNIGFFNKCIQALKDLNITVVTSVGEDKQLEDFDKIPNNFILKSYVPQMEVLEHTSLFITHAGMNSTNEAILSGVPMIAMQQSADQPVVAQQIENLNLGIQLNSEAVTPTDIKEAVKTMLDKQDEYKRNISKIIDNKQQQKPGFELAADRVIAFRDAHCKS